MSAQDTTIVIHIGLHKTGTSSIQKFLDVNYEILLKQGILYPHTGRKRKESSKSSSSHLFLAWSTVRRYAQKYEVEISDGRWVALLDEIDRVSPRLVVLSSEFFWWATDEEIQHIRSHIKHYTAKIILYLRNPLDLAISLYKQGVKTGAISSELSDHFMERLQLYDYESTVRRWENAFGKEQVSFCIYEKAKCDLLYHFSNVSGINWSRDLTVPPRTNTSPSDGIVRVIKWINRLEERSRSAQLKRLLHRLRRNVLDRRTPGRWLAVLVDQCMHQPIATHDDIERLRAETEKMINRFVEQRVHEEDKRHFVY
jgi:hypothetical protein